MEDEPGVPAVVAEIGPTEVLLAEGALDRLQPRLRLNLSAGGEIWVVGDPDSAVCAHSRN